MDTFPDLSVVIVTRNEAKNIARAIESVLRGVEHWPKTEVLLVDSASTDKTVEIAKQYPINIVRLKPSWFLSAAAGRYVGMRHTHGELILYMDGDMELAPGWLDKAVPFILEHPEVGGVAGYWHDVYVRDGQIVHEQDQYRDPQGRLIQAQSFGGTALYRRSALERVGGFNPYIISEEEPELCMRLRHAGYKLVRQPFLMCNNYTLPVNSLQYYVQRFRTNLLLGRGQVLRYHLGTGLFGAAFRERASDVLLLAGACIAIVSMLLAVIFQRLWVLVAWGAIIGAVTVFYWIRKRSLRKMLMSLAGRLFLGYGIVRGFLMAPKSPADYPTEAEVVQTRSRTFECGRRVTSGGNTVDDHQGQGVGGIAGWI